MAFESLEETVRLGRMVAMDSLCFLWREDRGAAAFCSFCWRGEERLVLCPAFLSLSLRRMVMWR